MSRQASVPLIIVVVALGGLCSCQGGEGSGNGSPSGEQPWQSGERVRARLAVSSDGFASLLGWHDRQLDVDCQASSVDKWCGAVIASDMQLFLDQNCSVPAVFLDIPQPHQGYAVRTEQDGTHIYELGPSPTQQESFWYEGQTCIPLSGLEDRTYAVRSELASDALAVWDYASELGPDVDAIATLDGARQVNFVSGGIRATDDTSTRLRLITDSLGEVRAQVGIYDSERDEECEVAKSTEGLRCLPRQTSFAPISVERFRDAGCQEPVEVRPEPGILRDSSQGVVSRVADARTLDPGPFYANEDGPCIEELGTSYYPVVELPLLSFESLSVVVE